MQKLAIVVVLAFAAVASGFWYDDEGIGAYHFHTYFFEENPRHLKEALDFRKETRKQIDGGLLAGCSLNAVIPGIDGPHPFGQYEMCCNRTWFPEAMAWYMKNHGNLSVLIHPLTVNDLEDHLGRTSWLGKEVPIDAECPCLYPVMPKPRPCPVYPDYPDELPGSEAELRELFVRFPRPVGTEDYRNFSQVDLMTASW